MLLFNNWFSGAKSNIIQIVYSQIWHHISDHPKLRAVISEVKLRRWAHLMRQREIHHSGYRSLAISGTLLLWCFLSCTGSEGTHLIFHRLTYCLLDSKPYSKILFIFSAADFHYDTRCIFFFCLLKGKLNTYFHSLFSTLLL